MKQQQSKGSSATALSHDGDHQQTINTNISRTRRRRRNSPTAMDETISNKKKNIVVEEDEGNSKSKQVEAEAGLKLKGKSQGGASNTSTTTPLTPPKSPPPSATSQRELDTLLPVTPDPAVRRFDFFWDNKEEPHAMRRRAMLQKYPQIRSLMRYEPVTKYLIIAEVTMQLALAYSLRNQVDSVLFWIIAYIVGGTLSSSLVLGIHEVTHFLAFKSFMPNKILACIANIPIVLPFCVEFKKYHTDHHRFQGVEGVDGDLPTKLEGILFNSTLGKLFFCTFQILFYAIRPKLVAKPKTYNTNPTFLQLLFSWYSMNFTIQIVAIGTIFYFWGIGSIVYLLASVFFSGSLHPMAGHFIAEHYVTVLGQETYSYYRWLNWLAFNVGYHNEHHDFPNIPWTLLPELRKIAPEFYNMVECKSWTWVIYNFIMTPSSGPYSRVKRTEAALAARTELPSDLQGL